jgi:hypothetical protein
MKIEGEIWLAMEESPYLWVSDHGRFFRESFLRHQESGPRKVKAKLVNSFNLSKKGYCRLNAGGTVYQVHRLVGKYFIPNPGSKAQINHLDGNKKNNAASNLEWVTNQENRNHAVTTGLQATRANGLGKLNTRDVLELELNWSTGEWTQKELGVFYGVGQQAISKLVKKFI